MVPCPVHAIPQPAVCETCAKRVAAGRRRLRGIAIGIGVAAATAAIVAYVATRKVERREVALPMEPTLEDFKRERLAKTPCDPKLALDLVEHLMEQERWADAATYGRDAIKRCGSLGVMRWRVVHSLKQLKRWSEATPLISELIAEQPGDSDFWWWRGEARASEHPVLALADYRQSIASSDDADAAEFAIVRIHEAADRAKLPCEVVRAWRYYARTLGGTYVDDAPARTCGEQRARGRARVANGAKLAASIGNASAELAIDRTAGTTLLSRELATKAGISPTSTDRTTTGWGGIMLTGQPARVPKLEAGGLSATNVDVVISDDLAAGDDGVLGLNFLWQFDVTIDGDKLGLSAPRE